MQLVRIDSRLCFWQDICRQNLFFRYTISCVCSPGQL